MFMNITTATGCYRTGTTAGFDASSRRDFGHAEA